MTEITPEALEALSKAATQGVWEATERAGYHEVLAPDDGCDWYGRPKCHAVLYGDTEVDESGENAAFIVALVNAYRTGQLIPAPSVETVVVPRKLTLEMETAGIDASLDHFIMDRVTVEGLHKFYEAAISAMQVKP